MYGYAYDELHGGLCLSCVQGLKDEDISFMCKFCEVLKQNSQDTTL